MRGADLTVIERDVTLGGVNPAFDAFTAKAWVLHPQALSTVREAGRALGSLPWRELVQKSTRTEFD